MLKNNLQEKLDIALNRVMKPASYIGGELNSVVKQKGEYDVHFAFCFPDTYEIGMSSMGMSLLYGILNETKEVYCERVFAPAADMAEQMKALDLPLFTLETKTAAADCDIVGFSLSYELSYTNILYMLDLAGIPFRAKDRGDDYPLLVAGGPCCYNPGPFEDFFDLIMIGDGEEQLPELCRVYNTLKKNNKSKKAILEALSSISGCYVPSVSSDCTRSFLMDLNTVHYPLKQIVPLIDVVHNRAVIELFRGCTRGCRFCQAGMLYRPVRERDVEKNIEYAESILEDSGHTELSLLSLSSSDYSCINEMADVLSAYCKPKKIGISLPSLRLDNFSFDMLSKLQGVKKTGLTFACEAGTQRLRDVINKNVTESDLIKVVTEAASLGWNSIKLYFMCGLPTESYEDLDAIADLAEKITDAAYCASPLRGRGRFNVNISLSNFVPKPFTPFQWCRQDSYEEFEAKHAYLKNKISKLRGVTIRYHDSFGSILEALFARGDKSLSKLLEAAYANGCFFDAWTEHFDKEAWIKALRSCNITAEHKALSGFDIGEILPWDYINAGVDKEYLISEYEKAMTATVTKDCRYGCNGCGINKYTDCPSGGIYE